jgi:hypothetical protein
MTPTIGLSIKPKFCPAIALSACASRRKWGNRRTRAEWALAFLTHCPRHRGALWSRCSGCREVASLGWGLGRGQPPTLGCRRCVLEPGITFLEPPAPLSVQEQRVLALEAALLGAVGGLGSDPQAPEPGWIGAVGPADFVRSVGS